jgi:hypothetical protein
MDVMLKSANMPTKEEINEIYKELFSLKKQIKKINPKKKTRTGKINPKKKTRAGKNDSGV